MLVLHQRWLLPDPATNEYSLCGTYRSASYSLWFAPYIYRAIDFFLHVDCCAGLHHAMTSLRTERHCIRNLDHVH